MDLPSLQKMTWQGLLLIKILIMKGTSWLGLLQITYWTWTMWSLVLKRMKILNLKSLDFRRASTHWVLWWILSKYWYISINKTRLCCLLLFKPLKTWLRTLNLFFFFLIPRLWSPMITPQLHTASVIGVQPVLGGTFVFLSIGFILKLMISYAHIM